MKQFRDIWSMEQHQFDLEDEVDKAWDDLRANIAKNIPSPKRVDQILDDIEQLEAGIASIENQIQSVVIPRRLLA